MTFNGLWKLKKLVVIYCDWGGSSCGMRDFIESQISIFKQQNPHLEVVPLLKRGKHPHLRGYYRDTTIQIDYVKNMDPKDILLQAITLLLFSS